jgi:DNA-binding NarL/FixJ family response regulator
MIKVIIADDQSLVIESLRLVLEQDPDISIIAEAVNGKEVIDAVIKEKPDVVVTDIQMPEMGGIELTRTLQSVYPEIKIIGLTMYEEDYLVVEMMEAGAKGYVMKDSGIGPVAEAIHAVYRNRKYFCDSTSDKLIQKLAASTADISAREDADKFNEKEKEIIRLVCQEFSNKEIAEKMHLGLKTIESYRNKIFEKTGVKNMAGLAVYAIRAGIYKA